MNWDDLRVFCAVSAAGNLTSASVRLGVSASTVHRRIVALEESIGAQLFVRTKSGHALTEAGSALEAHASTIESVVHELHREIAGRDYELSGAVRISTTQAAADYILLPAVPALRVAYPNISLELESLPEVVSLMTSEPSIALRFQRPQRGDYSIRKLGELRCSLYASRRLPPRSRAQPRELAHIGWTRQYRSIGLARWLEGFYGDRPPALAVGTMQAQVSAARAGLGAANLPSFIAAAEPDLVDLLPGEGTITLAPWLVVPRSLRSTARVEVVTEFVAGAVATAMLARP